MPKINDFIRKTPPFQGLDDEAISLISSFLHKKEIDAGEFVIWEGDSSREMYIVEKGWLKVIKSSHVGREIILHLLGPGDVFNALAAFTEIKVPATVVAFDRTVLYCLNSDQMSAILEKHPVISRQLLQQLALRLLKMIDLIGDLSLRSVEARLAELLLNEAEGDIFHRQKWLTQVEMAGLIGTVPDVLNRVLNNFVESGLIEFDRNQIKIIDREGLLEKSGLN